MKKIIFVEKEETNFDPVAAFFNKKAPSAPKHINPIPKQPSSKLVQDKKSSIHPSKCQIPSILKSNQEITPKIDSKGEQVSNSGKPYPLRDQAIKSRDLSRTNNKKQSKTSITNTNSNIKGTIQKDSKKLIETKEKFRQNEQKRQTQVKQDSLQKIKEEQLIKPGRKQKNQQNTFLKKIKQLEARQQQYLRKIQELQAKQQKYVKNEQKLLKIQKQMKNVNQKSKEIQLLGQKLKDKQNKIKQLLQDSNIPFNKKREMILNNKIKQLKKQNRELILRIKNYKGSDLVDLSIQQNRQEITNQLYAIDVEKHMREEMNSEMESLLVHLINHLRNYLDTRIKEKGERSSWSVEQTFLIDIIKLSQKISLNYLQQYQLSPIPKTNQQAISAYSILEQYKSTHQMKSIIDKFDLNFTLSKENMDLLNSIQSMSQSQILIKSESYKQKRRKQDHNLKLNEIIKIHEKNNNFLKILLIQNICQLQFIKSWIDKISSKFNAEVNLIVKLLSQIRDIVSLGSGAKESLYVYLQTNLSRLQTKLPNLKMQIRQVIMDFNEIQKSILKK